MNVRQQLIGFVALQRLLTQRAGLKREMETPPDELVTLRASVALRDEALQAKQTRRATISKELEGLHVAAEALREEREHFRKQKSMVTNMKQLTAVVSELDHVDVDLKAKEDRILEIMQETESLDREIATLQEESPEERAIREQAETQWAARRAAATRELQTTEREMREVQRSLGEASVATFKKLWTSRRPIAVVPLDGTSCSACHAELRPSLVQLVRTVETLECCDSCRRLLFDPEQFSVAT